MSDPNIIVKGDYEPVGYQLAPHEIASLTQSLGAHQQVLGASQAFQSGENGAAPVSLPELRVNRRKLTEQAQQIKNVLDRCTPQPCDPKLKDKYAARCRDLEVKLMPYLETREELRVKKRDQAAWQSASEKARIRTQEKPEVEAWIAEWKYLRRKLDPQNPQADSLHNLRKDR